MSRAGDGMANNNMLQYHSWVLSQDYKGPMPVSAVRSFFYCHCGYKLRIRSSFKTPIAPSLEHWPSDDAVHESAGMVGNES